MGFSLVMELIMEEGKREDLKSVKRCHNSHTCFDEIIIHTDKEFINLEDVINENIKRKCGRICRGHNIKTKRHNELIERLREKLNNKKE